MKYSCHKINIIAKEMLQQPSIFIVYTWIYIYVYMLKLQQWKNRQLNLQWWNFWRLIEKSTCFFKVVKQKLIFICKREHGIQINIGLLSVHCYSFAIILLLKLARFKTSFSTITNSATKIWRSVMYLIV